MIQAHLPPHIAKLGEGHEPGTPEYRKYVAAAHDWHHKVSQAVTADNPHMKHSFGEGLHPRTHGYNGHIKSTKALDKLHSDNGAHYSLGEGDSN